MDNIKVRYNGAQRYGIDKVFTSNETGEIYTLPKIVHDAKEKKSLTLPPRISLETPIGDLRELEQSEEQKNEQRFKQAKLMRLYRYRLKGLNSDFNYFCTITYDDKKTNEDDFHKGLLRTFSELKRTNPDFRYIGAFERGGKTERLHFHCIINIADFVPIVITKHNLKKNVNHEHNCHPLFYKKYGLCDFKPINRETFDYPHTIRYITKYLLKDDGFCEIHLSRGIKDYEEITNEELNKQYHLFDDVFVQSIRYRKEQWHEVCGQFADIF